MPASRPVELGNCTKRRMSGVFLFELLSPQVCCLGVLYTPLLNKLSSFGFRVESFLGSGLDGANAKVEVKGIPTLHGQHVPWVIEPKSAVS